MKKTGKNKWEIIGTKYIGWRVNAYSEEKRPKTDRPYLRMMQRSYKLNKFQIT